MNYLHIDEQTLDDLAIFSKNGKPSVYELYNRTITQGGSARLEQLFRHPMANEESINQKAAVYRFFSTKVYVFPLGSEMVSTVAWYLDNQDVRTQLQITKQTMGQLLKDMVATDADHIFVRDGVQATLQLFFKMRSFVLEVEEAVAGSAYEPSFRLLKEVLNDAVFSSLKAENKLLPMVLAELDKLFRFHEREKLLQLLALVYELDVAIAVGQVARAKGFHFARALAPNAALISCKQLVHPHVNSAIANDLLLNREHNVLFLTGANMAGKSTLMKSIGIALYLAHMGLPVAATEFSFAVRDGIFTSINLADNLSMGASHYYAEVLRVKEVAVKLKEGKRLFVIFDELFRGTNVKDAYDATMALTEAFCRKHHSQFIISTHIMEAGEVLRRQPLSIKYQYLPTVMQGNTPMYPRILKDGITADRQGMLIIQNEGILELLDAGIKENTE